MKHILVWFVNYMDRFWKWGLFLGFNFMWITAWLMVLAVPNPIVIVSGLSAGLCIAAALCNAIAASW